nr:CSLREA domain-containing protein [uncultured Pseudomonas sp.]
MFILRPADFVFIAALLLPAIASHAAALQVTTGQDDYDGQCDAHCSLRDAIAVANQSPGLSSIQLPPGNIVLSQPSAVDEQQRISEDQDNRIGDLDVLGELHILGASTGLSRIRRAAGDRLIEVASSAELTLEHLTLEGGTTPFEGGAVKNQGHLLLREVQVLNNWAYEPLIADPRSRAYGGAIANYGMLTVLASTFRANVANIYAGSNRSLGGAIYNVGNLLVRDSLFRDNSSSAEGAVLYNMGSARIERSYLSRNSAYGTSGGAIVNEGGVLTLSNSTLNANWGGVLNNGVGADPGRHSKAVLNHVTITRNPPRPAGGLASREVLLNWSELLIRNSLVVGNISSVVDTGALTAYEVANCANLGDSFTYQAIGLLRNDEPSNCRADLYVTLRQTFTQVLSRTPTQYNTTNWTHDLLPGSPAIDAAIGDCPDHDQRGAPRPWDGNGDGVAVCDLGAYELIP